MHRHLLILASLAAVADQKSLPKNPYLIDLVELLFKNGGKWILAAAGSNGDPPPYKSCIELTVTDTGKQSDCILVAHNHTIRQVKVVKFLGINENNETDILSMAPIQQYMVKRKDNTEVNEEVRNEVDWDTAISTPICWNPQSHKFINFRYIITPVDKTTEHLYLVAVNTRSPIPEYQVAILTKTKVRKRDLEKIIKIVNYRNFEQLENSDNPGLFSRNSLPRLQMQCAGGFDMHDPYDTINREILNMKFNKNSPPFPDKEFNTILVKHHK